MAEHKSFLGYLIPQPGRHPSLYLGDSLQLQQNTQASNCFPIVPLVSWGGGGSLGGGGLGCTSSEYD